MPLYIFGSRSNLVPDTVPKSEYLEEHLYSNSGYPFPDPFPDALAKMYSRSYASSQTLAYP